MTVEQVCDAASTWVAAQGLPHRSRWILYQRRSKWIAYLQEHSRLAREAHRKKTLAVRVVVPWGCERGVQQPQVADPGVATVFGEELLVHGEHGLDREPRGHLPHLANSRRALRYFFIPLDATFICRSKAGS